MDIDRGPTFGVPTGGPLAGLGSLWRVASAREPGYRSRLYRGTLPYVAVAAVVLIASFALVVAIALAVGRL